MQIEHIISDNENLVYFLANQFKNYYPKEDLYQVGKIGILKAYQNYDEKKGAKFSTYAYSYILGEMKKLVREDRCYKVSRDITRLNLKIEQAYILLTQKLMKEPTIKQLAEYLEIDEYLIEQALNSTNQIKSIDEPINTDSNQISLHEILPNIEKLDLDTLISLKICLENLTEEERNLIEDRYFYDLTQTEISQSLGINQVQVSRTEQKILKKMRRNLK